VAYTRQTLDQHARAIPPRPGTQRGRGIVISAGGFYLISGYLAVRSLRAAGCALPIQLWHLGPEELPPASRPLFEREGVECVDSHELRKRHPMRTLGGWQNKVFSIVHSPFEEVFSFDADNIALGDPTPLFDDPGYRAHGQIFWPDFLFAEANDWTIKPFAWEFLGLAPRAGAELESGQLLVNKAACWEPLMLTLHMNEHAEFYYERCTYGDKDTWRLAWEYLRRPPNVVATRPTMLEDMVRIQHAPDGSALFQHSRKWLLPVARNGHLPGFRLERECLAWLAEFESALARAGLRFS
jgi:alpha 1,2-mannosyltransferase